MATEEPHATQSHLQEQQPRLHIHMREQQQELPQMQAAHCNHSKQSDPVVACAADLTTSSSQAMNAGMHPAAEKPPATTRAALNSGSASVPDHHELECSHAHSQAQTHDQTNDQTNDQTRNQAQAQAQAHEHVQPQTHEHAQNIGSEPTMNLETIYDVYKDELMPMIIASIPILCHRLMQDIAKYFQLANDRVVQFLLPTWTTPSQQPLQHFGSQLAEMMEKFPQNAQQRTAAASEFIVQYFDTNQDGHISPSELLNMTEIISLAQQPRQTFWMWFSREWPLMDWKVGVFLWRSFGGVLLVLCILSIIPGRLHSTSGKVMRWPILALTYFLIMVELGVYIIIRLGIYLAETVIATPRHRVLRSKMSKAKSYDSWYQFASALDVSQKRDAWQNSMKDNTSYRYNWSFVRQLIVDLRAARRKEDALLALAVLQQCTRKNVGGVMSEDLFSYTNTGEPKKIVRDFCSEVVKTLRWITEEAESLGGTTAESGMKAMDASAVKRYYERKLTSKVRGEQSKIWKSVVDWTTLPVHMESTDDLNSVGEHSTAWSTGANDATRRSSAMSNAQTRNTGAASADFAGGASTPKHGNTNAAANNNKNQAHTHEYGSDNAAGSKAPLPPLHRDHLIHFIKRARAAYGRTALCLSGGAMMGLYHFGHIMGLIETDCLPNIISGTSAGSVIGAMVCTRTDEEIRRDMIPEILGEKLKCFARNWPECIKSFVKTGAMFDVNEWLDMIRWFTCGDMTFEEAYKKTGRALCITLSSTTKKAPPLLLSYISAPNVTIASAVIASAAVPGFVQPVQLRYKDRDGSIKIKGGETYFDGSIETDIPINGLAEMMNCQFFIACQCNPHVVPFFFDSKGGVGRPNRWSSGDQEASWRGGFLLAALEMYLKNDMKAKFVFLNDLEAAVGFTSTMMTQEFVGSTTIVPQVRYSDYFKLFSDPNPADLHRYFQGGAVAAYRHASMIRLHYSIADALDACLERLERIHGVPPNGPNQAHNHTSDEEYSIQSSKSGMMTGTTGTGTTSPPGGTNNGYNEWIVDPPAQRRPSLSMPSIISTVLSSKMKADYSSESENEEEHDDGGVGSR